jgi:hypothetical protein
MVFDVESNMKTRAQGLCSEGTDDSSDSTELAEVLAVYCLEIRSKKDPSRRLQSESVHSRVHPSRPLAIGYWLSIMRFATG